MMIHIRSGITKVTLTKREKRTVTDARDLLLAIQRSSPTDGPGAAFIAQMNHYIAEVIDKQEQGHGDGAEARGTAVMDAAGDDGGPTRASKR